MIQRQVDGGFIVWERFSIEHPVVFAQITAFLAEPGYGSFTIFSRAGDVTHAERKISIEESKKEKSAPTAQ